MDIVSELKGGNMLTELLGPEYDISQHVTVFPLSQSHLLWENRAAPQII